MASAARLPGFAPRSDAAVQDAAPADSALPPQRLLHALSCSDFVELIALDDSLRRRVYELKCIQGNWSVREFKRQIHSLYFERSGLSLDKRKLSSLAHEAAEQAPQALAIRDPCVFEFLGLAPQDVMSESHFEDELTTKLEAFLLELGHGFCVEARQKRILIGDEQYFVDLAFHHRILTRCSSRSTSWSFPSPRRCRSSWPTSSRSPALADARRRFGWAASAVAYSVRMLEACGPF